MNSQPLVSCIMPTRNRRSFVAQAIRYFQRQDYSHKELLILDDGEDAVGDQVPADGQIRYRKLDERLPLGAKRNLAASLSRGELIAHWDDDDWMSPARLSLQVAHLEAAGADVCGVSDLLHYRIEAGEAWLYRYPPGERPWAAGGTLLYRRKVWAAHPFPEINVGEDTAFLWQLAPESLTVFEDAPFYVALLHSGNTDAKNLADRRWQRVPLEEVIRLLCLDRDFYVSLRHGQQAAPSSPKPRFANLPDAAENPLVSCIMPTYNRRPFVPKAIEYFLQQDYPHRELIIVDDGSEPVSDLIPADPRLRYVQSANRQSVGAKRNYACEAAQGEIISCWDDDDWYGPDRLSAQVKPLLEGTAEVTGLGPGLLLSLPERVFWSCTDEVHNHLFFQGVVGGTITFWKSLWGREARFPEISVGEDATFLANLLRSGMRLKKIANHGLFVYVRHESNTWRFELPQPWPPGAWQSVETPLFIPDQDLQFYEGLACLT